LGIIIIDGRAALQFRGSIVEFEKAIVGLGKIQRQLGPSSLMIDTVPLPDYVGIIVEIKFKGSLSEFEKVITSLEHLRSTVAIDTVPLPEKPMIGTWPTPEKPTGHFGWTINAYIKS